VTRYFLGVDGGRSSTKALLGDASGRVIGRGVAGGCQRRDSLVRSVKAACRAAGLDWDVVRFEAACLGFSGGATRQRAHVERVVRAERLSVIDDAEIALEGATGGEPGIVTIAGTGSISLGRNGAGKRARAGGWGYLFGDEGSALDIVRQAVRAAVQFEEGWGQPTQLREELIGAIGTRSANEVLHRFYAPGDVRRRIARHGPLVDRVAAKGDAIARGILQNAAQQLATITGAVRQQLFSGASEVVVAPVGGVFESRILLERFRMLVELEDGCAVRPPQMTPVEAALQMAMQTAGVAGPIRSPSARD